MDPGRFRGTCYRAANWIPLGSTTGRGKDDLTHKPNRPVKEILVHPLHRRFRDLLSHDMKQSRRRIDINLNELDQVLDHSRAGPLSDSDCEKLRTALHTLAQLLTVRRSTEKTSVVIGRPDAAAAPPAAATETGDKPGHGRNPASALLREPGSRDRTRTAEAW